MQGLFVKEGLRRVAADFNGRRGNQHTAHAIRATAILWSRSFLCQWFEESLLAVPLRLPLTVELRERMGHNSRRLRPFPEPALALWWRPCSLLKIDEFGQVAEAKRLAGED